jgi:TetR/AcrR family transcriptional repressor of nem operon
MARPREFDRDQVLEQAMELFWHYGYAGTSLEQLDRATKLKRGSLYNAFGDKRRLFLESLDRYGAQEIGAAVALLSGPGAAVKKVRALFMAAVGAVETGGDRRGCLLCNSAIELAPHDKAVEAKVVTHLGALRAAFHQALKAEPNGRPAKDAARLADQLTANYMGLLVMAKAGFPIAALRRIAEGAIRTARDG